MTATTPTTTPTRPRPLSRVELEAAARNVNLARTLRHAAGDFILASYTFNVTVRTDGAVAHLGVWLDNDEPDVQITQENFVAFLEAFRHVAWEHGLRLGRYQRVVDRHGYDMLLQFPVLNPIR